MGWGCPASEASRPRRVPRGWLVAVAAVTALTLALAVHTRERVLWRERTGQSPAVINDFGRWLVMAPQFLTHHADYVNDDLPNPPLTLIVLAPFSYLSPADAQFVWVCAKALMVVAIFTLCRRMVRAAGVQLTAMAILLIVAVWFWPVIGDVQEGQTNLLMLLPLVCGLTLAQVGRPTTDWLAGVLVALAAAIKVTPLVFLPYFLLRRRWRVAAATVLGLAIWFLLVPGLAFGWAQNLRWLGQWHRIMIAPYITRGHVAYAGGQSLASVLSRTLRHVPPITDGATGQALPYYLNVVDWPEPIVGWIVRAVLLAIVLVGIVWMGRPLLTLRSRRFVVEAGALAAFMLWASERTWVPHYVTLVLTLFAAGMVLSDPTEPTTTRRRARNALIVAAGLMALTGDLGKAFGPDGNKITRTLGVSLWSSVLLVAVIVRSGGAQSRSTPTGLARRGS